MIPPESMEDAAQIRMVAEQVGESAAGIAISKFVSQHPEVRRGTVVAEIPAPLKWASIIASAIITIAASGGVVWLVSSVSEMSVTLARMDERMVSYISAQETRMREIARRVETLENQSRDRGER